MGNPLVNRALLNTGSKQPNWHCQAYCEVLKQHQDSTYHSAAENYLFQATVLPSAKAAIARTESVDLTGTHDTCTTKLYKSFLSPKGIRKSSTERIRQKTT